MSKHTPKRYFDSSGNLIIKPYRLVDLQTIYDVDCRTFKKMIAPYISKIGEKRGNYYSTLQVTIITKSIGSPSIAK